MEEKLLICIRIALKYNVTDIHFDVSEDQQMCIEMRIQGRIFRISDLGVDITFFRYLLYRANLDITDTYKPQTGRFELNVDNQLIVCRLSLVASFRLTSAVLRILNNHSELTSRQLTFNKEHIQWLQNIQHHRNGLYLFSGPTGSGKTTTLYTLLNEIQGKKIFTLEDPVEIYNQKYVQLQINEEHGFGYAEGIKQLMRHDPDIIMIGEIRDSEAAAMAVRSALTGHLVLSSIHSSDCASTIERMHELGVPEYQLNDVLKGIANQRLYDTADGKKTCIYETMNEKEIRHYLKTKTHLPGFRTLEQEVMEAVTNGWISAAQAQEDLS